MAIDTPAKIAILGAGPIGIEAALYARFLGYEIELLERHEVAEHPRRAWDHVRMFTPFVMNRSSLGLAALRAHDPQYVPPDDTALVTGGEWAARYLVPLAETDLLAEHIRTRTTVLAVGKETLRKTELPGEATRGDEGFRILVRDAEGTEQISTADVVIDTTGIFGNPGWLGPGGIPAVGEIQLRSDIEYGLPDPLGRDRERYAGRRVLVVGQGYSAATNVVALAQLAREAPGTHVTWVTRRSPAAPSEGPVVRIAHDRLDERDQLARRANKLAASGADQVLHWPGTMVEAIAGTTASDGFTVTLVGEHAGRFEFDRIVANIGGRPDIELFRELQVQLCFATEGLLKVAAAVREQPSSDFLDQPTGGPAALLNPEMDCYVLGSKSYGRDSQFLFSTGLRQIRELFTIIGDRETLDLYANAERLPQ